MIKLWSKREPRARMLAEWASIREILKCFERVRDETPPWGVFVARVFVADDDAADDDDSVRAHASRFSVLTSRCRQTASSQTLRDVDNHTV